MYHGSCNKKKEMDLFHDLTVQPDCYLSPFFQELILVKPPTSRIDLKISPYD